MMEPDQEPGISPAGQALFSAWLRSGPSPAQDAGSVDDLVALLSGDLASDAAADLQARCTRDPLLRRRLVSVHRHLRELQAVSPASVNRAATAEGLSGEVARVCAERLRRMVSPGYGRRPAWTELVQAGKAEARAAWAALVRTAQEMRLAAQVPVLAPLRSGEAHLPSPWAGVTLRLDQCGILPSGHLEVTAALAGDAGVLRECEARSARLVLNFDGERWPLAVARVLQGALTWDLPGFAEALGLPPRSLDPGWFEVEDAAMAPAGGRRRFIWSEVEGAAAFPAAVRFELMGVSRWTGGSGEIILAPDPEWAERLAGWELCAHLTLGPSGQQFLGSRLLSEAGESLQLSLDLPPGASPPEVTSLLRLKLRPARESRDD